MRSFLFFQNYAGQKLATGGITLYVFKIRVNFGLELRLGLRI